MYFAFQNSKGWLKSCPPAEYSDFEKDAMFSSMDMDSYDSDDLEENIIKYIMEIASESGSLEMAIHCYNDSKEELGRIIFDSRKMSLDTTKIATPEIVTSLKSLVNDIADYIPDIKMMMALSGKKPAGKSLVESIAEGLGLPPKKTISSSSDVDEIIDYINEKTKATISKPKETLADYVCSDTLKEELNDIKDFFENKDTYIKLNIDIPKGILFKGPPGTGKTYAARCIAGSVDCYFMQCTASALQGQYVGSGAENIRAVFKGAKLLQEKSGKDIILFIDEIDSFGSRGSHGGGAGSEEDRTVNQLLAEMSGFDDTPGIMVLAATNYADRLDDALMRSGRFSRQINIDYPDKVERLAMIKYYFDKIKMPLLDVEYEDIVALTEYFTPADIKELANESAILCVRNKLTSLTLDNINEAVNKNITKSIRNKDGDLDIHLVSAHEMGHVLAEVLLRDSYPIKVTSYSYGGAGGFTQSGFKLRGLQDKASYVDEVKILLGGRAAEQIICGRITNGASNDLDKAKRVLMSYYKDYMFEKYDVKDIEQLVLDDIHRYYDEICSEFLANKDLLNDLTDTLYKERIIYTKDIIPIVLKYRKVGSIL